jgi:hypothetical protein
MAEDQSPGEQARHHQRKRRQRRAVGHNQPRDREIEQRHDDESRADRLQQPDEHLAAGLNDREIVQIVVVQAEQAQAADHRSLPHRRGDRIVGAVMVQNKGH